MNEYSVTVQRTIIGVKITILSPDDTEYYLSIVNADITDGTAAQIVKQLVASVEGVFLREGDPE